MSMTVHCCGIHSQWLSVNYDHSWNLWDLWKHHLSLLDPGACLRAFKLQLTCFPSCCTGGSVIFWPVLKDNVDDRQQKRILSTFISWSEFKILYALHPKTLSFPYCHHTPFFCARHRLHGIFPVFTMAQEYHKQLPFFFHVFPMKSFCIISHFE